MSFSCKHYDHDKDWCSKLNLKCIPGRNGCVLKGKVCFAEDVKKRLKVRNKNKNK